MRREEARRDERFDEQAIDSFISQRIEVKRRQIDFGVPEGKQSIVDLEWFYQSSSKLNVSLPGSIAQSFPELGRGHR
jgi:hypothetical protein